MTGYRIRFAVNGQAYCVDAAQQTRLLDALSGTGLPVRKPCRNGVCGLCRCKLLDGEISYQWRTPHGLCESDRAEGYILPCIAFAVSDLLLEDIVLETT